MGTYFPGMKVNALDLSPNYAGTLMALVNGIGAIAGIVTPYLVGVLTPDVSIIYIKHLHLSLKQFFQ
jgi:ACS family sodium-dependent inorganic phosphate cotransporter